MDKSLEGALAIISIVFVLYTAMIDPMASLWVAIVAIVCLFLYRKMFDTKTVKKVIVKKVKKTAKRK